MRITCRRLGMLVIALGVLCLDRPVQAGTFDFTVMPLIPPNRQYDALVTFTDASGGVISSTRFQFLNGTNAAVKKTFSATAPVGTKDREFEATASALAVAGNFLPNGQIGTFADYG